MESVVEREQRIARLATERAVRRDGAGEARSMTRETLPPMLFQASDAGPVISPRNALGVSAAFACVRALADAAASLPMHVYRHVAGGGRERVHEHPTAQLLSRPAPAMPPGLLVWQMLAHLNLHGEAFLGLYGDDTGGVGQLGLIAPDRVDVNVAGGIPLYTVTVDDQRRMYTTDDIVHVRAMTLDGVRGVSPIRQAREALGYAQVLAEHGSRSMRNGARPSGVLTIPPGPAAEDLAARLSSDFTASTGGQRVGGVAVLTGEAKFEAVSMTLQDAQWIEQRRLSDQEVARIFRVPGFMIGVGNGGDSLTYSTVSEQARAFVTFGLRPWLVAIEQALAASERLFPAGSGLYPAFDLDGLLRGDAAARATVYTAALDPITGWLRRDEVRGMEDLPAEPDRQEELSHA